jgi:hypothetical protein
MCENTNRTTSGHTFLKNTRRITAAFTLSVPNGPTRLVAMAVLLATILTGSDRALGDDNAIENRWLRVRAMTEPAGFEVTARDGQLGTVRARWMADQQVTAKTEPAEHALWGPGKRLVLKAPGGFLLRLTLFEKLPFVFVQDEFRNTSGKPRWLTRREFARLRLNLGKPVEELQAFGTFGVSPIQAKDNPGSYNHLAVVEPESRRGAVLAWLTHERGSGLFFYDGKGDETVVTARQDYGRVRFQPDQREISEPLLIGLFDDVRLGLESYADAVAAHYQIKLRPEPVVYCTWYHVGASNEKQLRPHTDFAAAHLKPFGFGVVQIDSGWQDGKKPTDGIGERKVFVRHNPKGGYPGGMKAMADYIRQQGLVPGLWFMPFAGTYDDPYFADKQEWFVQKDGKPCDVLWGGSCLDMTHPQALELTRLRTTRICQDWGYRYIKIDGLWTATATKVLYVNDRYREDDLGKATYHNPEVSNLQAYRIGLKAVREAAGPETYILGALLAQNMRTLGGSFGCVDSMRIGPDNAPTWELITRGPFSGSNLYFLHRRVWNNDPDPVYVRPSVPLEQARTLLSWVTLTGQQHTSSIYYADLPEQRLDMLKRAMPSHTLRPRPVDLFEHRIPHVWLLSDERSPSFRYVLGLFNWDEKQPLTIRESIARIGLPKAEAYVAFDFWANAFRQLDGKQLDETLPPTSCRILAVRPVASHPQLISTSRHITQGVVDVVEETWDSQSKTLQGTSRVVANDPYELRIARPADGSWALEAVNVSRPDREAGVTIKPVKQDDKRASDGWRVRIDSPGSREVHWATIMKDQ